MSISIMGTNTLDYYLENGYKKCPKRRFIAFKGDKHIAIDNSTGDFFVEEFEDMNEAMKYLKIK